MSRGVTIPLDDEGRRLLKGIVEYALAKGWEKGRFERELLTRLRGQPWVQKPLIGWFIDREARV
jgi:hypothetical protein